VACLYTVLTLIYFWPLPRLWADHIGPGLGDSLFNLYVLKWGVHQIRLGLPDLWDANIFYPARGALAFSDHLLGPAAQLALFETVIPNAIAGFNFLFVTAFAATAFTTCWVMRRSGLSWVAAVLAGWMYVFSPVRVMQMPHIQMLIAQWIPLTLWFWDRLLAERTAKNAALFLLFYLLNLAGGCYLAYMIHFPLAAILASRVLSEKRELISLRSLRVLVPVALVAGAAVLALFLPYVRVSHSLGLSRGFAEIEAFGARPASYFSPAFENLYFRAPVRDLLVRVLGSRAELFFRQENALFAGFLPTIFFGVGALAAWRGRREGERDVWARGLALAGLVCFALSLTKVYWPLMHVIPGLSGMRVPARFYAFVSLTLVYFAGRGVDVLMRRLPGPRARVAVAAALAVVLAVELGPGPVDWERLPREEEMPAVYRWVRDEPTVHALLELPIRSDVDEADYLYAATVHWKPIANGYSGYAPPIHEELAARIHYLPGQGSLELLRSLGISHLVVHARRPERAKALRGWEGRFGAGPERQVEPVYAADGIYVYRLLEKPGS